MKVVCAWCGGSQGEKEPFEDPRVTHTICLECKAQFEETSVVPSMIPSPSEHCFRYEYFEEERLKRGIKLTPLQKEVARDICIALERLPAGGGKTMLLDLLKRFDL